MTEAEANQQAREINEDVQRDNGMLPPVRSEPLLGRFFRVSHKTGNKDLFWRVEVVEQQRNFVLVKGRRPFGKPRWVMIADLKSLSPNH
jgi:hypothetical protein